jgi:signal transduction histidine kinase
MKNEGLKGPWIIIIIALLLVAVILVLGNQSFQATEKAAFDEFNQRQLVLAREATGGIELYFENLAGDMRALARRPEVQRLDEAPTRQELQHTFDKLQTLGVNDVGVLDADGALRYNVAAPEIEGVDFSWRRYYQEAKKMIPGDTYVVEFIEFKGVDAGQKGVLVAVPMFETATDTNSPSPSGQFAGVVLCTLKLDTITQKFVAPIQSSKRGHAFLIDDELNVLWAPGRSLFGKNLLKESAGFPAFQQVVASMSAGHSGAGEYAYYKFEDATNEHNRDQEEGNLIAYAPIHLGDELWAIGVWAPKEDARQLIRRSYLRQLFVVGLSILIILLGASYALATSFRISKFLEEEVEAKTGELKESHQRLLTALDGLGAAHAFRQSVIDGVAEPIMVISADYQVRLMNRAAREFSTGGAVAAEPIFCYQISHQRQAPCKGMEHPCPLEQVRESGQPIRVVHDHHLANGERRHLEVIAAPLWEADGSFQGIIESMRDITERVQSEEALQQYAERLRALTAKLAEVGEAERQRLARALHDQVGQNLTALGINLNIVRSQMHEKTGSSVRSRLDDSLSLVEQTTEGIRDVMANLRPSVLDDYGLVAALNWYGEQFAQRTDIAIAVEGAEPSPRPNTRIETALFRIAQEALTNVAKHAQATQIRVHIEAEDETLRLLVADDGIGFEPAQLAGPDGGRGWGLLTMSERAEAVGGRCWIKSEPGQGTQVIVEVFKGRKL